VFWEKTSYGVNSRMQLMGNVVLYILKELWDSVTTPFYYHLSQYAFCWAVMSNLEEYAPIYAIVGLSFYLIYLSFYRADSVSGGMLRSFASFATLRSIARAPFVALIGTLKLSLRLLRYLFKSR
jgi:hypothetical protein